LHHFARAPACVNPVKTLLGISDRQSGFRSILFVDVLRVEWGAEKILASARRQCFQRSQEETQAVNNGLTGQFKAIMETRQ
jgi:hypothetical protein